MDVKHCPVCGSDSISRSSGRKEYSSYTKWVCTDCDWSYQSGSGMGWYDTKGTHPRRAGPDDSQSTLTDTGVWCSNCETCAKDNRCRCMKTGGTPFCDDCAAFSENDKGEMIELRTYVVTENCSICEDNTASLKLP